MDRLRALFLALLGRLVRLALVGLLGLDLHKLSLGVVLDLLVRQNLLYERLLALSVGQAGRLVLRGAFDHCTGVKDLCEFIRVLVESNREKERSSKLDKSNTRNRWYVLSMRLPLGVHVVTHLNHTHVRFELTINLHGLFL